MMRSYRFVFLYVISALLFMAGCREPFNPSIVTESSNYLVVEGFLNLGEGATNIYLSRTTKVNEPGIKVPELNASLQVEGTSGLTFSLHEMGGGRYSVEGIIYDPSDEYRLRIITSDGKEYLSDFVATKATPAIDSISWKRDREGVTVYVNAHDPTNATRYYLWEYEETWEYRSPFTTDYDYEEPDGEVINRDKSINIERCWNYGGSDQLIIGTTAKLSQDVVHLFPLLSIPEGNIKLSQLYSILVRQYALSSEAYEYLRLMKSNTESVGSIFDPQPSGLRGNIHAVEDPNEPVIGYVFAANVEEQRIFIERAEVPDWSYVFSCPDMKFVDLNVDSLNWNYLDIAPNPLPKDPDLTTLNEFDSVYRKPPGLHKPIRPASDSDGWMSQKAECVDCRLRGGINIKPDFWTH